jgi:hypothetical protein
MSGLGRSCFITATTTDDVPFDVAVKFHAGLRSGAYLSIEDFEEEYRDQPKVIERISAKDKCLDVFVRLFVKDLYSKLKWKEPIDTLREYCQSNPLAETETVLSDSFLKERELYKAVDAVARIVLRMGPKKIGTVIMYGKPNTGKSMILGMLEKIFISYRLIQTTRDFDCIPELKPH